MQENTNKRQKLQLKIDYVKILTKTKVNLCKLALQKELKR